MLKHKPVVIGIAGGTCSGKSSIAGILIDEFRYTNSINIIREDDYYKDQSHLPMEERAKTNYDHPLAFDFDLMIDHLNKLIAGETIEKPTYDYTVHNRSNVTEIVHPSDVLIIEGLFALYTREIRDLEDIKIFVDTPADIRFIRRLKRDVKERARTIESITDQYLTTVKPMHDQFLEPTKQFADIIIPQGKSNTVAIDLLKTKINSILNEKMI
ncbi:MAG: uridine kinase [Erysipelotrichaceae bacterium]|jgi:uridine kinase|nr:uridine kinase [Erysipelotrichaceae bacterium]MBP1529136.1 uridine kinase [Erysipelotrichaceae bacterium]MBQ1323708.1 uridine kinase [Erysipelotrichaceae bacterium]MBQ1379515.1 uridine kinase [Erysipelotrichaceae bacterium]MBQ1625441.1 uridine kinase [Erysipelotrichaceae bacterium]